MQNNHPIRLELILGVKLLLNNAIFSAEPTTAPATTAPAATSPTALRSADEVRLLYADGKYEDAALALTRIIGLKESNFAW